MGNPPVKQPSVPSIPTQDSQYFHITLIQFYKMYLPSLLLSLMATTAIQGAATPQAPASPPPPQSPSDGLIDALASDWRARQAPANPPPPPPPSDGLIDAAASDWRVWEMLCYGRCGEVDAFWCMFSLPFTYLYSMKKRVSGADFKSCVG